MEKVEKSDIPDIDKKEVHIFYLVLKWLFLAL